MKTLKVKRFDGNVTLLGDGSVTVYATGDQSPTSEYDVVSVVDLGGTYVPVRMRVSVSKQSGKVIAVAPQIDRLQ